MKVLSYTQPWGFLSAYGKKQIETRSWSTNYRGEYAIHASKGFPKWARDLCFTEPFLSVLCPLFGIANYCYSREHLLHEAIECQMPLGALIGSCFLMDCVPTGICREVDWLAEGYQIERTAGRIVRVNLSALEKAFGDYSSGRFAWLTNGAGVKPHPIPARGRLGLWETDLL